MEDFAEARKQRQEEREAQVRLMEHQLDRQAVEGAQERQKGLEDLGLWSGIDRSVAKKAETGFTSKSFKDVQAEIFEAMKRHGVTVEAMERHGVTVDRAKLQLLSKPEASRANMQGKSFIPDVVGTYRVKLEREKRMVAEGVTEEDLVIDPADFFDPRNS